MEGNAFEYIICKVEAILFEHQYVNWMGMNKHQTISCINNVHRCMYYYIDGLA